MVGISLDHDGLPDPAQVAQAASGRVMVTLCI
jgi:hypothetical protein